MMKNKRFVAWHEQILCPFVLFGNDLRGSWLSNDCFRGINIHRDESSAVNSLFLGTPSKIFIFCNKNEVSIVELIAGASCIIIEKKDRQFRLTN